MLDHVDFVWKLQVELKSWVVGESAGRFVERLTSNQASGLMRLLRGDTCVFHVQRAFTLVFLVFMAVAILYGTVRSKKGKPIKIRPILGLMAIEEAVGRATELGSPLHYSTGSGILTTVGAPESLASVDILSYVANLCAKYDCDLIVTNRNPVLHSVAEAIVREAYTKAGVPEKFKPETVRFVSEQQFPAAAQAMGIMEREKIAANIMFGNFAAEALLLAEAAAGLNAIQIASTTNVIQIPFFVACCDYTLLGDEMFAGGAYCSKDLARLGATWGQDIVKLVCIGLIALGTIMQTLGSDWVFQMLAKYGR